MDISEAFPHRPPLGRHGRHLTLAIARVPHRTVYVPSSSTSCGGVGSSASKGAVSDTSSDIIGVCYDISIVYSNVAEQRSVYSKLNLSSSHGRYVIH